MEAPPITIYHNGECSKCRGALEILQEQNIPHSVRWYLADPMSIDELRSLVKKLAVAPSALVRKSEPLYAGQYDGKNITEDEWLTILSEYPVLIQRPIIEKGQIAIIARPTERVFEIINN